MKELTLTIHGVAPSVNHMYRNFNNHGRRMRVLSSDAETWSYAVSMLAKKEVRDTGWTMAKKGEKVVAEVEVYWPDRKRRDVENLGKLLWDSLEGIVYEDDSWILPRYMDFAVDRENPRIEIKCYRLGESV